MRYQFENAYLSSYNNSSTGASTEPPTVELTIAYTPIEPTYSRDEFEFFHSGDRTENPNVQSLEIKSPSEPPSQTLPFVEDIDMLALVENPNVDPMAGLLLPAVQQVREPSSLPPDETTIWDDLVFG
ncbi:MAG: hypothetical protein ABJ246_19140 [Paracoccaceae bacterium]